MAPMKACLMSLSLATILLSGCFRLWSSVGNRFFYHWQRDDALVLALTLAVVAAIVLLTASVGRRRSASKVRSQRILACLLVFDVVLGHTRELTDKTPQLDDQAFYGVIFVIGAVALVWWRHKASLAIDKGLLVLSPLAPVLLAGAITWPPVTGTAAAASERPVLERPDGPPVVLMVFDEWSWHRASAGRAFRSELHAANWLAGRATVFHDTRAPAAATKFSLPRVIFQSEGHLAPREGRPFWHTASGVTAASETPSIFSAAAAHDYASEIVGFYLPYRELVGEAVGEIVALPGTPKPASILGRMGLISTRALQSLGDPLSRWLGYRLLMAQWSADHYELNLRLELEAVRALERLDAGDLLLLHLAVPHAPFVFDREGRYVGRSASGRREPDARKYADHLVYADAVLGRLLDVLRQRGVFDETMIVATSDHGWRTDPALEERTSYEVVTHVPLVIKWPKQGARVDVDGEFCLTSLQTLLDPVEAGVSTLPTAQELEQLVSGTCDPSARARDSLGWTAARAEEAQ
jgi:hypothetical protein